MAEKIDIVVSTTVQLGNSTKSIEELKRMLEDARIAHQKMVAQFGEGSKEAEETANAIKEIELALNRAQESGKGLETPVKSMKQQLKEANADLQLAVDKFGLGSKEAAKAAKKVAELKDTIGDAKTLTDAFNPDAKFKGLENAVRGSIGAITALQGAQALFGNQSEEVAKTLAKVQGALALSQGVNSVLEAKDSFKALGNQIKSANVIQKVFNASTQAATAIQKAFGIAVETTSVSFKALRGAIIATGIGALVIVLGTVIEKIMAWTDSTKGQEEAQNALNKELEKSQDLLDQELRGIEYSTKLRLANAKKAGASEEDLTKITEEQNDKRLAALRKADEDALKISDAAQKNDKISSEEKQKLLDNTIKTQRAVLIEIERQNAESAEKQADAAVKSREKQKQEDEKKLQDAKDAGEKAKQLQEKIQQDREQREAANAERQRNIEDQIQQNRLAQIADGFYKERLLVDTEYDNRIQQLFDKEKELKDSLDKSLQDGLISRKEYNNQIAIIQSQSAEERKAIEQKYNLDIAALERKELERRVAAQKETDNLLFDARIAALEEGLQKSLEVLEKGTQDEIDAEIEKLNKKEITQDEYDQRRLAIEQKYQNSRKKIIEDNAKKELDAQISKLEQQVSNDDLSLEQRLEALDKEKAALDAFYAGKVGQEDEYNAKVKKLSDARISIQLAELAKKQELEKEIFQTIQSGVDLYSTLIENQLQKVEGRQKQEEKVQKDLLNSKKITQQQYEENIKKINEKADKDRIKLQKRQIIAEKAMGVANIILNTLQANAKSVAQFPITGGQPWVTLNTIQGALGVATTIAQAAKALAALGAGGDSGGGGSIPSGSGGSAPIAPQQQTTTIDPNQVNQIASANATVRAYVVESDVSGNQERISRLNRAARIS